MAKQLITRIDNLEKRTTHLFKTTSNIEEKVDSMELPSDLSATTLDLLDKLTFTPTFRSIGKVVELVTIPSTEEVQSMLNDWQNPNTNSTSNFALYENGMGDYQLYFNVAYNESSNFIAKYGDTFVNYTGPITLEVLSAYGTTENLSMNVTSTTVDTKMGYSITFNGTGVKSSQYPTNQNCYFAPGYSSNRAINFQFTILVPEKNGVILDQEIFLPEITSDLILGDISEVGKTIEYADYPNSSFYVSNYYTTEPVKQVQFQLYSMPEGPRAALASEIAKAVASGSFYMYFYDSNSASYINLSVVNARDFYKDGSNYQITFNFDKQDENGYAFEYYSIPTETVGFSFSYIETLNLSVIDSVINNNTLLFTENWGLSVGDTIQVRNSINSIGFKDAEGVIQKVISYNNKTGEITYDGVKESVIISDLNTVFSVNAAYADQPDDNNGPWKTTESVNIGKDSNTYGGGYNVTIGSASSSGTYGVGIGNEGKADNSYAVSIGYFSRSQNNSSVAIGPNASANGLAIGSYAYSQGYGGGVAGPNTKVYNSSSQGLGFTLGTVRFGNVGSGGSAKTFLSYTSGSRNRQAVLNSAETGKWYWNTDNYYNPTQTASDTYNTDIYGLLGNEARNSVLIIKGTLSVFGLTGWTSSGDGIPSATNYKIVDVLYVIGKSNTSRFTNQWQIINQVITTKLVSGNGTTWDMGLELTNSRFINPFSLITTATTDAQYALRGEISIDTLKF